MLLREAIYLSRVLESVAVRTTYCELFLTVAYRKAILIPASSGFSISATD